MKTIKHTLILGAIAISLVACKEDNKTAQTTETTAEVAVQETPLSADVMSAEEQAALTPDQVITLFKEGNERYVSNNLTPRDYSKQVQSTTAGQFPQAIVLSCVDSRVPVEHVLDRGIGDIFVARVAGNFVNEDILGSMEFATKVSGSKLVMVMGHEHCGAVKAAIDNVELGNITPMLSKIKPAVAMVEYEGERNAKNGEFVAMVCESNVKNTIEEIRKNSPIMKEMEDNGEIKIVGAVYDLDSGIVSFLD
ncbi:carbonic anhydrase family protein [Bizionia sediminis]|uniref:Carbonic anhydrase family protein n=1 Tax=Bizionia sediminis TaxID=1737064 RepID=A0ABW5KUJ0_9FLAO